MGERISRLLTSPLTILLVSDLGGGKTTFTKGLAIGLGISSTVHSPTYTLHRSYSVDSSVGITSLDHFDLYRTNEDDTIAWVIQELLEQDSSLLVIEWPNKSVRALLSDFIEVNIDIKGEDRVFSFYPHGPKANRLISQLEVM